MAATVNIFSSIHFFSILYLTFSDKFMCKMHKLTLEFSIIIIQGKQISDLNIEKSNDIIKVFSPYDGWKIRGTDPFFKLIPHIMNKRNDAQVFFDEVIEINGLEKFIRKLLT